MMAKRAFGPTGAAGGAVPPPAAPAGLPTSGRASRLMGRRADIEAELAAPRDAFLAGTAPVLPPTHSIPPMPPEPPADPLAARAQVELDLLRAAATTPPAARAEALARAGRWLADAVKELSAAGADPALVRRLTDLATEVARTTGAPSELWARVEATLVELASRNTPAPKPARRAFWKR